jgi:hypothetical protein
MHGAAVTTAHMYCRELLPEPAGLEAHHAYIGALQRTMRSSMCQQLGQDSRFLSKSFTELNNVCEAQTNERCSTGLFAC